MTLHEIKCWPEYFQALWTGAKEFEIRRNDRNYKVWDSLLIKEWNPLSKEYTGREIMKDITYIFVDIQGIFDLPMDIFVMQLR